MAHSCPGRVRRHVRSWEWNGLNAEVAIGPLMT